MALTGHLQVAKNGAALATPTPLRAAQILKPPALPDELRNYAIDVALAWRPPNRAVVADISVILGFMIARSRGNRQFL